MEATMRWWIMGVAMAVAACSQDPQPAATNTAEEVEQPAPIASPTPEVLTAIPTRFVGSWDSDAASCRATTPGEQRLVIAAGTLTIAGTDYPARSITAAEAGAVDVDVVADRSGITAQRRYRLALAEGGALNLTGVDGNSRRVRCDAPAGAEAAARNAVALNLAPDGIQTVAGASSRQIGFGTPAEIVLRVAEAAMQALPERSRNTDCGEGPLDIASYPRIHLYFQDGRFVGWAARGRGLTTMAGVGIGSKRADVEAVIDAPVEDTSLGREFSSGGLSGLYDAKDSVTELWAGSVCLAR
ncbi:hypothetical protein ASE78_06185 [Sphingomonas sp. Leaf25]|nr:hypothetical protein ASE78_06185 [Sphingomonas sp. Leaf25]